jgi:hypothetical protein
MYVAFPRPDYYEGSVTVLGRQPTVGLPVATLVGQRGGRLRTVSHVHHAPVGGVGAQLCPCSIATGTPQAFPVASGPAKNDRPSSRPRHLAGPVHCHSGHPPGCSRRCRLRGFETLVPHVHLPALLAGPGPSGSAWPVPSLSRLLSALSRTSGVRLPSASPACCDRPAVEPFHLHPVSRRLVAHTFVDPHLHPGRPRTSGRGACRHSPRCRPARPHRAGKHLAVPFLAAVFLI